MRPYDAVFLDAQGTILAAHPSTSGLYRDACASLGIAIDHAAIASTVRDLWMESRGVPESPDCRCETSEEDTRAWWTSFNTRLFTRLGMVKGLEQFLEKTWDLFGKPESYRAYPEVLPVLTELRDRGYRMGIVSNWDSRLIPICEALGITPYMDFILASSVVGVEKPDRRIFDLALARASVLPHQAVHVGDDYHADVLGARWAGIEAVHLDRDGSSSRAGRKIETLRGLLDLLP